MLILTRRVGESVVIDGGITITVLSVKGAQVRLGVNAPKHVTVHREEIQERIRAGVEAAGKRDADLVADGKMLKDGGHVSGSRNGLGEERRRASRAACLPILAAAPKRAAVNPARSCASGARSSAARASQSWRDGVAVSALGAPAS